MKTRLVPFTLILSALSAPAWSSQVGDYDFNRAGGHDQNEWRSRDLDWRSDLRITLYRNDVIPVRFSDEISFRKSREGDRFEARVDDSRLLPRGSVFEGKILNIRYQDRDRDRDRDDRGVRRERPGMMTLTFERLRMPDGTSVRVDATPIAWHERSFRQSREGRWEAKDGLGRDDYVLGGFAGGLVLGSIARKPFEGAFLGTLAGIIASENDKSRNGDVVIRRGDKVGALIEKDVRITLKGRVDRWDDNRRYRQVMVDGREVRFDRDQEPYEVSGKTLVPLEAMARALDLTVRYRDGRDLILIEGRRDRLSIDRKYGEVRLNSDRSRPLRNIDENRGVLYIPVELFEPLTNSRIRTEWHEN